MDKETRAAFATFWFIIGAAFGMALFGVLMVIADLIGH
jgi:hypothetical protein